MNTPVEVVEITPSSGAGTVAVIHDRADHIFRIVCSHHDDSRGYRYSIGYGRGTTANDISLACATAVDYGAEHAADCQTETLVPLADATRGDVTP